LRLVTVSTVTVISNCDSLWNWKRKGT